MTQDQLQDFETIKEDTATATFLSIDEELPFVVECDASDVAVSATLKQFGRPVAFISRTQQDSEGFYSAVEKEATTVIEAVCK